MMTHPTNEKEHIGDEYLGDGVYVAWDGEYLVLDLRGQAVHGHTCTIAMDPSVIDKFESYLARVKKHVAEVQAEQKEDDRAKGM